MNFTLRTVPQGCSAGRSRKALRSAFASLVWLLFAGCGGNGFALEEVAGGFVLGADASGSAEGSEVAVDSSCSNGPGGPVCPAETPRCLPSASGGFSCIAAGTVALGAVCAAEGVDDCALGAICVKADDVEGWRCRALCEPAIGCAGEVCTPLGPRGVSACLPNP